jgi:hypothetical protein
VEEQAVLVHVPLPAGEEGWNRVSELADRLVERIEAAGAGEYDGEVVGEGWATFYSYGPDADRLWQAVAEAVDLAALPEGAHAVKRYGGPGAREVRV